MANRADGYHHGNLKPRLLEIAARIAAERGVDAVGLRELAREAGVSHSAPVHHFSSRRNLLTALAVQGFASLSAALEPHVASIYDMGTNYVMWALEHPGHYAVMWRPRDLATREPELEAAREQAWQLMSLAVEMHGFASPERTQHTREVPGEATALRADGYAAFSIVHGLSSLWLSGALPMPADPAELAGEITRKLRFSPNSPTAPSSG